MFRLTPEAAQRRRVIGIKPEISLALARELIAPRTDFAFLAGVHPKISAPYLYISKGNLCNGIMSINGLRRSQSMLIGSFGTHVGSLHSQYGVQPTPPSHCSLSSSTPLPHSNSIKMLLTPLKKSLFTFASVRIPRICNVFFWAISANY